MSQPTLSLTKDGQQEAQDLARAEGYALAGWALAQDTETVLRHGARLIQDVGLASGAPLLVNISTSRANAFWSYVFQQGRAKPSAKTAPPQKS